MRATCLRRTVSLNQNSQIPKFAQFGDYSPSIILIHLQHKSMKHNMERTLSTLQKKQTSNNSFGAPLTTHMNLQSLTMKVNTQVRMLLSSLERVCESIFLVDLYLAKSGIPHWTLLYTSCYYSVRLTLEILDHSYQLICFSALTSPPESCQFGST